MSSAPAARPPALRTILSAGLLAGGLDITAAILTSMLRGRGPVSLLQAIASGLLGQEAFAGGAATAALGLFLHFVIATTAAAVYYAASRRLGALNRHPIASGLAFGVAVWLFMNLVVLPLSAIPFKVSHAPTVVATGLAVHMLCVGLPIALMVRRFAR